MNQKNRIEERRCSERESRALFGLVRDGMIQATRAGVQACEVWLGPKEARILEVEMNWQDAEGRLPHTNANDSALIRGTMEGVQLMGLRVRLMEENGVSVGITWPNNSNK